MATDAVYMIVECVARRYGMPVAAVVEPKGQRARQARQTAVLLADLHTDRSRADLADWFGFADESSYAHVFRGGRPKKLMGAPEMEGFDPAELTGGDVGDPSATEANIGDVLAAVEQLGRRVDALEARLGIDRDAE